MGCAMEKCSDGSTIFWCGSGIEPCSVCGDVSISLCDYPVGPRKTCDQQLCEKHSIKQGAEWQDIHFCPTHTIIDKGMINKKDGK